MSNSVKKNPPEKPIAASVTAYGVVSQMSFVVISPLLIFIGGGSWLADKYNWESWAKVLLILLGVLFMIGGLISYFYRIINLYGKDKPDEYRKYKTARRDSDYYVDNYKKKFL